MSGVGSASDEVPITVNVRSLETGATIPEKLQVCIATTGTVNDLKKLIFAQRLGIEADPVHSESYKLVFGHGGSELNDGFQRIQDSLLYNECTVLVAIDEKKDELLFKMHYYGPGSFISAPRELCDDKDVVIAYLKCSGHGHEEFRFLPDKWRADKDVVMVGVAASPCAFKHVRGDLCTDMDVLKTLLAHHPHMLQSLSAYSRANKELVMIAVMKYGSVLQYASDDLRADRGVVMAAVKNDSDAFQWASDDLRADRDVVMVAVAENGLLLDYASAALCADRDVVMAAVAQNGRALQYATGDLFDDPEVVIAAVKQSNYALVYASLAMQTDPTVRAYMRDWSEYKYCTPRGM